MNVSRVVRHFTQLLAFAAITLDAGPSAAQAQVTETLSPAAVEAHKRGLLAVQQQDWPLAIRYFEEAFKAAPQAPDVVFNLALAEAKVPGRELRAIARFQMYLALLPEARNAAAVKNEVATLEVRLEGGVRRLIERAKQLALQAAPERRAEFLDRVGALEAMSGDTASARQTAASVLALSPDTYLWSTIPALAMANDVAGAKDLVWRLKEYQANNAYLKIIEVQAKAGDIQGASDTLGRITHVDKAAEALRNIAVAQHKAGRRDDAHASLIQARDRIRTKREDGSFEYHYVGKLQAELGDIAGATATAALITKTEYRAEVIHGVITAHLRANAPDRAAALLAELPDNYFSTGGAYGDVAQAFLKLKRAPEAARVLADVDRRVASLNPGGFRTLLEAAMSSGNLPLAERIVPRMPKEWWNASAVSGYALALADRAQFADALRVAESIPSDSSEKGSTLLKIMAKQLDAGRIGDAKTVAAGLTGTSRRDDAQLLIAAALRDRDQMAEAAQMIESAADWRAKGSAFLELVKKHLQAGRIADAKGMAARISGDAARRNEAYAAIAEAEAKRGSLDDAKATASALSPGEFRDKALRAVADAYVDYGRVDDAKTTASLISSDERRELAAQMVATAYAGRGEFQRAKDAARDIADPAIRASAYRGIASSELDNGYISAARTTLPLSRDAADQITDAKKRGDAHAFLVGSWLRVGDALSARAALAAARAAAAKIADPSDAASALLSLRFYATSSGMWLDGIESAFEAAPRALGLDRDGWSRNYRLRELAEYLAEVGFYHRALEIVAQIGRDEDRSEALAGVLGKQIAPRGPKWVEERVSDVGTPSGKNALRLALVRAYVERGDLSEAVRLIGDMPAANHGSAFNVIALKAARTGDFVAAKAYVEKVGHVDNVDTNVLRLIIPHDVGWGERFLSKTASTYRQDTIRGHISAARAKAGDSAGARGTLDGLKHSYWSDIEPACTGLAEAGDRAGATACLTRAKDRYSGLTGRIGVARALYRRGEAVTARENLAGLVPHATRFSELRLIAAAQFEVGDRAGAEQTLSRVQPTSAGSSWHVYELARSAASRDPGTAKALAVTITDPQWRSLAYRHIVDHVEARSDARQLAAQITEPLTRSAAYLELLRRDLRLGNVDAAAEFASAITQEPYRTTAIGELALATLASRGVSGSAPRVAMITDPIARSYVHIELARVQAAAGATDQALASLYAAQKSVEAISKTESKARAGFEISQALARVTGRATATVVPQAKSPSARMWREFVDSNLNKPMYVDPAAHIQTITSRTDSASIFDGLREMVSETLAMARRIKAHCLSYSCPTW